ncbi:MAG: 50S ribosomal protein L10 [Atribacterota bacterium]|nr:50S ribosomal protein L10 [Atribacterota bacterium]
MALSREKKESIVQELKEELKRSPSVVLSNYYGINVQSMTELRDSLREKDIKFKIYKNTLFKIAAKEVGLDGLTSSLSGSTAVAFAQEETLLPVKMLRKYSIDNKDQLRLIIALLEGKIYLEEQLDRIASLPDKEELLARILGNLKSPISLTVYTLKSPLLALVNVLDQIHKSKSKE